MSLRLKMDTGSPGAGTYVYAEDWILVFLNPMVNSLLNLLTNPVQWRSPTPLSVLGIKLRAFYGSTMCSTTEFPGSGVLIL